MAGAPEDLDATEPLARRLARHNFDRLIMLADGVFAIAVTLSALEIRLQPVAGEGWRALVGRLVLPLMIYALSFAVASFYWVAHRRTMARVTRTDGVFTALSLIFLACVALIPAATQFLIAGQGLQALGVYIGLIGLLAGVQGALWFYAAFVGGLVLSEVSVGYRWAHLVSTLATPLLASTLSFLSFGAHGLVRWAALAGIVALVTGRRWILTRWGQG